MKIHAKERLGYDVWAMANLRPKSTGLPNDIVIYVSDEQHSTGPRIKVSNLRGRPAKKEDKLNNFSVSIEDVPKVVAGTPLNFSTKEMEAISKFIVKNKKCLLDLWNGDIDSVEFALELQKI